jgi:hypothetical protein
VDATGCGVFFGILVTRMVSLEATSRKVPRFETIITDLVLLNDLNSFFVRPFLEFFALAKLMTT